MSIDVGMGYGLIFQVADYLDEHGGITETYSNGILTKFSVTENDVIHNSYDYRIQSHVHERNR